MKRHLIYLVSAILLLTVVSCNNDDNNDNNVVSATGVTLSQSTATLDIEGTLQLTATVQPENATNTTVTWSSSDATIATVSNSGLVTAVAEGTATITVTTQDGNHSATSVITVNPELASGIPVESVTLNKATATLFLGNTVRLTATVYPADATNNGVTWSSSNPAVATVADGIVTSLTAGETTITATTVDGDLTAEAVNYRYIQLCYY